MRICLSVFLLVISAIGLNAQKNRISTKDYIERFKDISIEEMKRSGIPASITLAQGIIESGSGNSTLAREANNHFGIKCHKWTGPKFIQDDDTKDECFRKYPNPEDSYRDHTDFLLTGKRYNFLFEYSSTDYEKWAHGLKSAGYATNPKYPKDLIRTIEENDLHRFDLAEYSSKNIKAGLAENFSIGIKQRPVLLNNHVKYIKVGKNDNLESLTKELGLFSWQLRKYNDLPENYQPIEGEILYIQPKRWSAERGNDFHIVKEGENMRRISQQYGMKLKKLYRKNRMEFGAAPEPGQKLWLRKRKPATN